MFRVVIWVTASLATLSLPWRWTTLSAERLGLPAIVLPLAWVGAFLPLYIKMVRSKKFHKFVGDLLFEYKRHRWQSDLTAMFLQLGGYMFIVWVLAGFPSRL